MKAVPVTDGQSAWCQWVWPWPWPVAEITDGIFGCETVPGQESYVMLSLC